MVKNQGAQTITVKLKRGNTSFEILCKPATVQPYREGKMNLDQTLAAEEIFSNASKFEKVKTSELKKAFKTEDKTDCIKVILAEGSFPLTKKELNEATEKIRGQMINHLHKYFYDPTKNPPVPHPTSRWEAALKEMRVRIDPNIPAERQLPPICKKLSDVLPITRIDAPEWLFDPTKRPEPVAQTNDANFKGGKGKGGNKGKSGKKTRFEM